MVRDRWSDPALVHPEAQHLSTRLRRTAESEVWIRTRAGWAAGIPERPRDSDFDEGA